MASAGARAYNGGLGAEPPTGSRGRAPGQGVRGAKPPEAEKLFAFRRPLKAANLPLFSLYCRLSKSLKYLYARVIAMIACLCVCLRHVSHAGIVSKRLTTSRDSPGTLVF